jgi:hypothetical protein
MISISKGFGGYDHFHVVRDRVSRGCRYLYYIAAPLFFKKFTDTEVMVIEDPLSRYPYRHDHVVLCCGNFIYKIVAREASAYRVLPADKFNDLFPALRVRPSIKSSCKAPFFSNISLFDMYYKFRPNVHHQSACAPRENLRFIRLLIVQHGFEKLRIGPIFAAQRIGDDLDRKV